MIEEQKEALAAEQAQEEQRVAKEAKEKELAEQKLRDEEAAKEKKAKQSKAALKLQQALEMKYQNLQSYADDSSKYQPRFLTIVSIFQSLHSLYLNHSYLSFSSSSSLLL